MGKTSTRIPDAAPRDTAQGADVLRPIGKPVAAAVHPDLALSDFGSLWYRAGLVEQRIRVSRGHALLHQGEASCGLALVLTGSCKSTVARRDGQEQITAFHVPGEIVGAEAIFTRTHGATTTALEDSEVWTLPLDRIEAATTRDPALLASMCAFLSSQVARDRETIVMLGTMRAEQRLAWFLQDLAARHGRAGPCSKLVLSMTRGEIALHLSLSVETVSRLFSRLQDDGLVGVRGRNVALLDIEALGRLACG